MKKILIITGHYLPGYKAGGPIRTLSNIIEQLGDEFQFFIMTADHDLGEDHPYENIAYKEWNRVGKAQVMYLSPKQRIGGNWVKLLKTIDYDILYLNGFFSADTRRTLFWRWLRAIPKTPVILAPRGEFSEGAVKLKAFKKRVYLWLTQTIHLYKGILWQASSLYEKQDILRVFRGKLNDSSIVVAPNLPDRSLFTVNVKPNIVKQPHSARIIFLSRITRKKNLDFALSLLRDIKGNIKFDIYGPIEDPIYWQECETLIGDLPDNIKVVYKGVAHPEKVQGIFSQYHLFLFPTLGENFGHVIMEAFGAGCPVLTSDQTPWRNLTEKKVGWDVPLSAPRQFRTILNELLAMDNDTFEQWFLGAREYGKTFAEDPALVGSSRQLFLGAIEK